MHDSLPGKSVTGVAGELAVDAVWRFTLVVWVAALAWLLAWYWPTATAMAGIWWRSETFTHGFVVPLISAWLVWRDRARILAQRPAPSAWPLLLLAGAGVLWLVGEMASANSPAQLALMAMLVLLVPLVAGWGVTRVMLFPLAFLFFAVPVGEFMLPQLMSSTADFTVAALRLTGVPVYREGQHLVIPSGQWSVVEACSGIRYLIASMMVGTLYAYLSYRSLFRRLGFVLVSALVPLVANWVRAYLIVLLGHLSNNKLATGVDHVIYGWVFFGLVMALMFWVGSCWREPERARSSVREEYKSSARVVTSGRLFGILFLLAVVSAFPRLWLDATLRQQAAASPAHLPVLSLPGWTETEGGLASWKPRFQWASDEMFRTYRRGGQEIGVYVGYYRSQSFERKLISSENVLVATTDSQWARTARGEEIVRMNGQPLTVATGTLYNMNEDKRLLAWQWYWIGDYLTSSEVWGKAYVALMRLIGKGDDAAVVIVYTAKGLPGQAEASLSGFLADAGPVLGQTLQQTRQAR